jgi:hypothetical protein
MFETILLFFGISKMHDSNGLHQYLFFWQIFQLGKNITKMRLNMKIL